MTTKQRVERALADLAEVRERELGLVRMLPRNGTAGVELGVLFDEVEALLHLLVVRSAEADWDDGDDGDDDAREVTAAPEEPAEAAGEADKKDDVHSATAEAFAKQDERAALPFLNFPSLPPLCCGTCVFWAEGKDLCGPFSVFGRQGAVMGFYADHPACPHHPHFADWAAASRVINALNKVSPSRR